MGAMASLALALGVSEADAQIFTTGDNSTYRTPTAPVTNEINNLKVTGGTIRMRSSQGEIKGKYGTTEANRMPGIVIWYCRSTIPGGTFFTDLGTGGDDNVTVGPGTIDISGDYIPGSGGGTGTRTYPEGSTVTFTGNDGGKTQTIPDEGPSNGGGFDVVELKGDSPKTTKDCDNNSETVIKQLKQTGARFTNKGKLTLANKVGANHTINEMTNDAGGAGDCGITLKDGATMDIATNYTNTSGYWKLEENSNVNLAGTFTYTAGKMNFACNSNFHYNGTAAQTITGTPGTVETDDFYAYGNLKLSNSEKTPDGNFNVCNDLRTESEVKLTDKIATMLNKTPNNHVFYSLVDGGPETNVEIDGKLVYKNVVPNQMLTFNNKDTKVQFESAADLEFGLDVRQQTQPDKMNDWDATKDVKRKVEVSYAGNGKISHLEVSWEQTDEDGTFTTPGDGNPIRFAEGYNAGQPRKKMIRVGATYNNDIANRIVKYGKDGQAEGILLDPAFAPTSEPGTPNEMVAFNQKLASGSQILLSTQTQKSVSVVNGRWSNPTTWDTGLEPGPNDDVELRTTVWVGDSRAIFGMPGYDGDERAITNATATDGRQYAARSITIENVPNAGLYVNMEDGTLFKNTSTNEIIFKTQMVGESDRVGIFNKNTNAEGEAPNTAGAGMNGIYLSAVTNTAIPVLGAANLNNQGTFTNLGVTEIGECQP